MKKYLLVSLTSILLFYCNVAFTEPIDSLKALTIAQKFYLSKAPIPKNSRQQSSTFLLAQKVEYVAGQNAVRKGRQSADKEYLYYVFNVENDGGFVIVAGDDASYPIIGYGTQGRFEIENQPSNLKGWMQWYEQQLIEIKDKSLKADKDIENTWNDILSGKSQPKSARVTAVAPLLQTTWDQNPYYNDLCPYDNDARENSVTGCTATAMAQIMKYWNHPYQGRGIGGFYANGINKSFVINNVYDWSNMPKELSWYSSSGQKNAIAKLMIDCGASINTTYNSAQKQYGGGSSANPDNLPNAYIKNFSYSSSVKIIKKSDYSIADWETILRNELINKRPIQYQGFYKNIGTNSQYGGHSFVIDGYDGSSYFHVNWGWGGKSDNNFYLQSLNPSSRGAGDGEGTFNLFQTAVIGIQPATNTNANLQMYSLFNATYNNQVLTVSTNFLNAGSSAFQGDFAIALFDDQNEFYDFVEIKNGYSLPSNNRFTSNLTFSKYNLLLPVGKFKLGAYYRVTNGDWVQIAGTSTVRNPIDLQIKTVYSQDINMYSSFSVLTSNPRQSTTLSVNFDVINANKSTFYGEIGVLAYDLQGNYKGVVSSVSVSNGLQYNYHYIGGLTISTNSLSLEPGIYNLVAGYKKTGGLWNWVGGDGRYTSGRKIEVGEAPIYADSYENNDSEATAYNFKYTPTQDYHGFITYGSNIHVGTDKDYYKIDLPQDSSRYIIKARVHDKNNSTQGDLKCDVIFSVNQDNQWSKTYDWGLDQNFLLSKGGKLMFLVSPIYEGFKGSYLLDFNVTTVRRPTIKVNGETTICEGEQTKLQANQSYDSYKWLKDGVKTDKVSAEISVSESGKYTLIGTKNGVESAISESIQVVVKSLPIKPTILKEEKPDKFILTSSSNVSNQWFLGNLAIKGATESIYSPEQVGKYFVRVSDGKCVNNSEVLDIKIDKPEIQKVGNNPFCEGEPLTLKAPQGFGTYRWFNGKDSLNTNLGEVTVSKSGRYFVWVGRGKIVSPISDTIKVVVNPLPTKPLVTLSDSLGVSYFKSSSLLGNQWFSDGTLINGATGQVLKNSGSGSYSVKVTLLGCSSVSDLFVITGTEELFERLVNVYPNPSRGEITIDVPFSKETQFAIYDLLGNDVFKTVIRDGRDNKKTLNLSALPTGTYILRIESEGKVLNRKISIL
ncbi:MAG: thiol protease/hemagglutinin PrtT [Arcicella sp.]|jgi:hypothetical protein|nr:thiol protease/hemagglutinin PrtT [Arcicella sp.]